MCLIFTFSALSAQSNNEIKAKSAELNDLRSDIEKLESELSEKSKIEKESFSALQNINNQNHLLSKLINKLKSEEKNKSKKISNIAEELSKIETRINELKKDYSGYVVWLYKYGTSSILKYLLDSESLNQAAVRYKYLSSITDENEKKLEELNENRKKYDILKNSLSNEVAEKEKIVKNKRQELTLLKRKKNDKQNIINKIKKDKSALTKEIAQKRKAEQEIKKLISKLIEEEITTVPHLRNSIMTNLKISTI